VKFFGWKVTARVVESIGMLLPGDDLKVTCELTPCTPGSAPGPTLGNEYIRAVDIYNNTRYNKMKNMITFLQTRRKKTFEQVTTYVIGAVAEIAKLG